MTTASAMLCAFGALVMGATRAPAAEDHRPQPGPRVFVAFAVNGHRLPYVTRVPATEGNEHLLQLDRLVLRLESGGRFAAFVRYRHRLVRTGTRTALPPVADAVYRGRYAIDSLGHLTLYPARPARGPRRAPWPGSIRGDVVKFTQSLQYGATPVRFVFELARDRSVF